MQKIDTARDTRALSLSFGFTFPDLYAADGLARLDAEFLAQLRGAASELEGRLQQARRDPAAVTPAQYSELIVQLGPYVEDFVGELFGIEPELRALQATQEELAPLFAVKRKFVQRKALTGWTAETAVEIDGLATARDLETYLNEPLTELSFAQHVARWSESEATHETELRLAARYAAWATLTPQGKAKHSAGVLFKTPHKLDMHHLVPVQPRESHGLVQLEFGPDRWRTREGFQLTDPGTDLTGALDQAHYCIKCHNQGKDSCSTGLREKVGESPASSRRASSESRWPAARSKRRSPR